MMWLLCCFRQFGRSYLTISRPHGQGPSTLGSGILVNTCSASSAPLVDACVIRRVSRRLAFLDKAFLYRRLPGLEELEFEI